MKLTKRTLPQTDAQILKENQTTLANCFLANCIYRNRLVVSCE